MAKNFSTGHRWWLLLALGLLAPALAAQQNTIVVPDHPAIEGYVAQYASERWRSWLQNMVTRSSQYVAHILETIRRHDLPPELVFLPVVESSYRVSAVSSKGAVGLWQLTRLGIAGFGLTVDAYVDERRDFWKGTEVALRILAGNYRTLGNWELALAAYNAGLTRVKALVAAAGTDDYWELRDMGLLPSQTREFVPRFLAAVAVYRQRRELIPEVTMPQTRSWARVALARGVHIGRLAELSGIPLLDLRLGNPELNYLVTPPSPAEGRSAGVVLMTSDSGQAGRLDGYWLKVPAGAANRVAAVLADPDIGLMNQSLHVVVTGDTLSDLALYYGSKVDLIESHNPNVTATTLWIGSVLVIPHLADPPPSRPSPVAQQRLTLQYVVKDGDTFWELSRRFGSTAERLAVGNNRSLSAFLHPGDILFVPAQADRAKLQ